MRLPELAAKLQESGVPPAAYRLSRKTDGEQFCIHQDDDGSWVVYYSERGQRVEPKHFDSEEAACDYHYELTMKYSRYFKR